MKYLLLWYSLYAAGSCCPLFASFTAWQGDRAYRAGDLAQARAFYEDAVSASPHDMQALYNVGKMAYKQKDYESARKAFEKVGTAPESSLALKEQAYFNKGDSEFMSTQLDEALGSYEQVLKLNPENGHAKERIEMLKKQQEQNKSDQQDQKQKQDKKDQNNKSESKSKENQKDTDRSSSEQQNSQDQKQDEQSSNQDSQSSDQQPNTKEQEEKQKQGDEPDKAQQQDKKSQENAEKDGNDQQDGNQDDPKKGGERSADARTPDKQKKEKEQEKSQQGVPQEHEKEQQQSSQRVPEDQLNAQERVGLEHIEERDKKAYKHFFGRTDAGKRLQPGQKNW